jgi:choline dehydrogenase-like flavoprotein
VIGGGARWLYWRANRKFMERFSEAVVGYTPGGGMPDGVRIMDSVFAYLGTMPPNAFQQVTMALVMAPLHVPVRLPRGDIARLLVKIWIVISSHFGRIGFSRLSAKQASEKLDVLFWRLSAQMPEQQDDLVKTGVILGQLKSLITAAYFELDEIWRQIGYSPVPHPPRSWPPPSGSFDGGVKRSAIGEFLHANISTVAEVARKPAGRKTYCVIGSGAGGAIAAMTIAETDPDARVLLLESGPLVTNEGFPDKLLKASAELYMNNGVTLTKDMMYSFRQGRCVGGSTTLNNSVSFKPQGFWWDQNIVERWKACGADLDWAELSRCYDELKDFLNVHPLEERVITPMARTIAEGFRGLGHEAVIVPSNTKDCIGCGRCNAGCAFDSKQSMLITAIPALLRRGGKLVPEAKVKTINYVADGDGFRVTGVQVKDADGKMTTIEADRVILAAGAYASSKLLWKSGFTGLDPGVRTVGKRFVANMGTPLVGRFSTPQQGWSGQQVGFVVELPQERVVIETAFAPPAVLGLLSSQWGAAFQHLVQSFDHVAIAVPVLAGETYGEIQRGFMPTFSWAFDYRLGGFVIDYHMGEEDWIRIVKGLKLSARAMFQMGAEEVFTTRFDGTTIQSVDQVEAHFDGMGPIDYLRVESAHMHGGNVIHHDPARGVVDADCKVHGFSNLWIADGSVIPAAITLNLQYTIMAVARYAAKRIAVAA